MRVCRNKLEPSQCGYGGDCPSCADWQEQQPLCECGHPVTVIEMIRDYLTRNKLDGLYEEDGECACLVSDLAPCGTMGISCSGGIKEPCDCGEHDWHIKKTPAKPLADALMDKAQCRKLLAWGRTECHDEGAGHLAFERFSCPKCMAQIEEALK